MPDEPFGRDVLALDAAAEVQRLAAALRHDIHRVLRRGGAAVGVSGGVDSAVTLALAVEAVGSDRVLAVLMPERESSPDSLRLGRATANRFSVEAVEHDITAALDGIGCYRRRDEAIGRAVPGYGDGWTSKITLPGNVLEDDTLNVFTLTAFDPDGGVTEARLAPADYRQIVAATNFKQRTRMAVLYHYAESRNFAVVGTSNRNEYDQGFFVKYGDAGYDLGPLRHLFKTQVYQLGRHLGVPEEILDAVPTTDTYSADASQEEFFFRMPFDQMDLIWCALDRDVDASRVAALLGVDVEGIERAYADLRRKGRTTESLRMAPRHYGDGS